MTLMYTAMSLPFADDITDNSSGRPDFNNERIPSVITDRVWPAFEDRGVACGQFFSIKWKKSFPCKCLSMGSGTIGRKPPRPREAPRYERYTLQSRFVSHTE